MTEQPITFASDQERWAEQEARTADKLAADHRKMAAEWAAKPCFADNYGMAMKCAIIADTWEQAANVLRMPRRVREDRELRGGR